MVHLVIREAFQGLPVGGMLFHPQQIIYCPPSAVVGGGSGSHIAAVPLHAEMDVVAAEADADVRVVEFIEGQALIRRNFAAQPDKGLLGHLHQPPGLHAGSGGGVEAALRADERIDQQRVELVFCGPLLHLPTVFAGVEQPVGLPGEGWQSRQEHCRDADQHHQSAQQSEQRFQARHPSPMRASQSPFAAFASASRVEVLGRM